jgi:hypothetical protein
MVNRIIKLIQDLVKNGFYGQLILNFEAGKIVLCKKTESIKLDN